MWFIESMGVPNLLFYQMTELNSLIVLNILLPKHTHIHLSLAIKTQDILLLDLLL